jgi:uncharacterized protein YbjT (DUF2867 family)
MTILITGASGNVGRQVVQQLVDRGGRSARTRARSVQSHLP